MKKNMIVLIVLGLAMLCVVGFQQGPAWKYTTVRTNGKSMQAELTRHAAEGWRLHSTMVIPNDQNRSTYNECYLIFEKKK